MPSSYQLRHLPTGTALDAVEVERYDPYTDSWTSVSPAPKYVSNFSAASCQGRLYLVGSSACKYNMLALQCYSPVTGRTASLVACTPEVTRSSSWGWGGYGFWTWQKRTMCPPRGNVSWTDAEAQGFPAACGNEVGQWRDQASSLLPATPQ